MDGSPAAAVGIGAPAPPPSSPLRFFSEILPTRKAHFPLILFDVLLLFSPKPKGACN